MNEVEISPGAIFKTLLENFLKESPSVKKEPHMYVFHVKEFLYYIQASGLKGFSLVEVRERIKDYGAKPVKYTVLVDRLIVEQTRAWAMPKSVFVKQVSDAAF